MNSNFRFGQRFERWFFNSLVDTHSFELLFDRLNYFLINESLMALINSLGSFRLNMLQ